MPIECMTGEGAIGECSDKDRSNLRGRGCPDISCETTDLC